MDWLQGIMGDSGNKGLQLALIFLALVVALLVLFWLFRMIFGSGPARLSKGRQPRLSVTDAAVVDDKRRIVLVRRDNVEHLVMIGGPTDVVVETNIVRAAPVQMPANPPAVPPNPTPAEAPAEPVERVPEPEPIQIAEAKPEAKRDLLDRIPAAPAAAIGATGAAVGAVTASAMDVAGDTVEAVSETGSEIAAAATSTVSGVAEVTTEKVEQVASAASDVTGSAVETVTEASAGTMDLGGSLAESLEDALGLDSPSGTTPAEVESPAKEPVPESASDDEMQKLLDELSAER